VWAPTSYHHTTTSVYACLVRGCYVCGFLNASIHTGRTFSL
jgi:olfactory receptor